MSESKIKLVASEGSIIGDQGIWPLAKWNAFFAESDKRMDDAEPSQLFKGKGRVNIYVCDTCHDHTVSRDCDYGVTPFMMECQATEGCKGLAKSCMYRIPESYPYIFKEKLQWYRPSYLEYTTLDLLARQHVERGGLLPRKVVDDESQGNDGNAGNKPA